MICRLWRGWTTSANADIYERVVRGEVIPAIEARRVPGFRRIDLMRRVLDDGTCEFATIMWFDDLEAVRSFAGDDYGVSHVPDAARAVLGRFEERAAHFETIDRRIQPQRMPLVELGPLSPTAGLLVIDVQIGFDDPEWGPRNNPDAEANIARLLDTWRATGRPVFHVQHVSTSPEGHFHDGSPGQAIKPIAAPLPSEPLYRKQVNSAFIGTDLEHDLRARGIHTLVIVGLTTNHCVSTSARMGANLGFRIVVVSDATAAFGQPGWDGQTRSADEVHRGALGDLAGEFASIVDAAEVASRLLNIQLATATTRQMALGPS